MKEAGGPSETTVTLKFKPRPIINCAAWVLGRLKYSETLLEILYFAAFFQLMRTEQRCVP